jgi:hypothetical protein
MTMRDEEARAAVSVLERLAESGELSPESVRAVVSAATRLFAQASDRAGGPVAPLAADVSTTDALILACALLRSHDLTPFDMAVWFSRSQRPT